MFECFGAIFLRMFHRSAFPEFHPVPAFPGVFPCIPDTDMHSSQDKVAGMEFLNVLPGAFFRFFRSFCNFSPADACETGILV